MNLRFFKNPTLQFTDARGIKKNFEYGEKIYFEKNVTPGIPRGSLEKV